MTVRTVSQWVVVGALLWQASVIAQSPQAQADAASAKFSTIMQPGKGKTRVRQTTVTQSELNAYLRYRASWLPAGITNASVNFLGSDRVATSVVADLDGVRKRSSGGWFDPTAYLSGKLPVNVVGTLRTSGGRGTFVLESATVDGVPVPAFFVQELFAYYTRSEVQPSGMRLDEPFVLPSEIERIDLRAGQAIVVQ